MSLPKYITWPNMCTNNIFQMRKVTITVVTICVSYICLTFPLTFFYVILFATNQFVSQSPAMSLGRTIVLLLALSNHAINFFLYVLTSANFRNEVKGMLGKYRRMLYIDKTAERIVERPGDPPVEKRVEPSVSHIA